ncbi:MAG: hypothetical protein CK425_08290 [Parachlamydia sp.]|nr:MAG: hypothetical protein CK425_08290 [Parachlamydia sp.]
MKTTSVFLFIFVNFFFSINYLTCFESSNQFQYCNAGKIIEGKYYVTPGSVHVTPDKIVVEIHGQFVQVDVLETDENGVYISAQNLCPLCGRPKTIFGCTNPSCPGYPNPFYSCEIPIPQNINSQSQ